ncbi:MAG TPA: FHA domain-containing protein [Kofleriaceae bacterium]|nr:FHA domain-containing protein [Kofleriaceae bacterium]
MNCLVCHEPRELVGGACTECLDAIRPKIAVTPEQVALRSNGASSMTSLLLDPWGRVRPLERRTEIGRALDGPGLVIVDSTVSRRHAAIELRDNAWYVEDFGSANGTFVEGQRIERKTLLRDGERVRFGEVGFFFLDPVAAPPNIDTDSLQGFTVRGAPLEAASPCEISIELREPSGGGGGIAVIDGKHVGLTLPQFELVALLHERAGADAKSFVHVNELAKTLSLDSTEPNEDNVRQLVRRLRRLLFKAGINGLIESRYGQGYRLNLARS